MPDELDPFKLVFISIIFPVILYIINKFIEEFWYSKKSREKNTPWLRVLNTSREINKCFSELKSLDIYIHKVGYKERFNKKLKPPEAKLIMLIMLVSFIVGFAYAAAEDRNIDIVSYILIIIFIGMLSFPILFPHSEMSNFIDNVEKVIGEISVSNYNSLLIEPSKETDIQILLDLGRRFLLRLNHLSRYNYALYFILAYYLFEISLERPLDFFYPTNVYVVILQILFFPLFMLSVQYVLSIWKNKITECLMKIVNEKYKISYPYITINMSKFEGKLEYLFDNDSIILRENGVIKAIKWDSIKCLEIQENEKSISLSHSQEEDHTSTTIPKLLY